jgi:hypothetical protein
VVPDLTSGDRRRWRNPRSEVNAEEAVSNRFLNRYHTGIATWALLGRAHLWLFFKRCQNLPVV